MLGSLKEMFEVQNCVAKQTAMKAILTTKMVEGSAVKDRVLNMMSYQNELEILGAAIDMESQVKMILQNLLGSFQQFHLNNNMNNMDCLLEIVE